MNVIGTGDFQLAIPYLNGEVGKEFIIVNVKSKEIVGKVRVMKAPKSLVFTERYTRKEVKGNGSDGSWSD